ncbi:MAG: hypothetical protein O3A01_05295 [bacterium]|nr:hypothetical protein [bacterium]
MISATPVMADNYAEYVDAGTLMQSLPGYNPDPNDDKAVIKTFQAMFIKKMFLDEAFKAQSFYGEEESVGMASGYGFYQEMMLYEMAQQMAKDDVFGLEHYFEGRR